jgi:hypothetical protein
MWRARALTSTTSSRRSLVWTSVAIAGLLCFSTYASAQPNKELYELQERCGKRAAEVFKREYSPPVAKIADGQMTFNYENHYSARLNKLLSRNRQHI